MPQVSQGLFESKSSHYEGELLIPSRVFSPVPSSHENKSSEKEILMVGPCTQQTSWKKRQHQLWMLTSQVMIGGMLEAETLPPLEGSCSCWLICRVCLKSADVGSR